MSLFSMFYYLHSLDLVKIQSNVALDAECNMVGTIGKLNGTSLILSKHIGELAQLRLHETCRTGDYAPRL